MIQEVIFMKHQDFETVEEEDRPIAAVPTLHLGDLHLGEYTRHFAALACNDAPIAVRLEPDFACSESGDGDDTTP